MKNKFNIYFDSGLVVTGISQDLVNKLFDNFKKWGDHGAQRLLVWGEDYMFSIDRIIAILPDNIKISFLKRIGNNLIKGNYDQRQTEGEIV